MGVNSVVTYTYVPPNYNSALAYPLAIMSHIQKELPFGCYTGPLSQSRLESIIGPFEHHYSRH